MVGCGMRATVSCPVSVLSADELDAGTRITLITLYALAREDTMIVWAHAQEIADINGYTMRSIHAHVQTLMEHEYLRTVQREDPRGGGYFRGYELRFDIAGKDRWQI
jgi:hypothetical protein